MTLQQYQLTEIKIEVTHRCPLACIHCSSDANPTCIREISLDKCLEILENAVDLGVKQVAFSGGEPLIWPYLEEAIKYLGSKNIETIIYTSGNIADADDRFEKMYNYGLKKTIFSIFGPDAKSHEKVTRIAGSFHRTVESIKSANNVGLQTELHFVALARNYTFLNDIAKLSKTIGISKVSVLRFVPQGRGYLLKKDVLSKIQSLELKRTIVKLRDEGYDIRTGSPFNVLLLNETPHCLSAIDRVIVGPDLRIYPCDAFKQIMAEEVVGTSSLSTLEHSSLKECWQSSPYFEAVRKCLSSGYEEPCKSCGSQSKCLSGCLAQKVIVYGGLLKKPDPLCLMK